MLAGLLESDVLLTKPSPHLGFLHVSFLKTVNELGEKAFGSDLQFRLSERLGRGLTEADLSKAAAHLKQGGFLEVDEMSALSAEPGPVGVPYRLTRAGCQLVSA